MTHKPRLDPSVESLCRKYCNLTKGPLVLYPSWYFCDNPTDADVCANLVQQGIKCATAPSLLGLQLRNEPVPAVGDKNVVTNFAGKAVAIIETVKVEIVPYYQVDQNFAWTEGEGDRSLDYWRRVHWPYYQRELAPFGLQPTEDMDIVCEYFEVVCLA